MQRVIEDWRFLGTAQTESALYEILESRPRGFDQRVYRLLNRALSRLPPDRVIDLIPYQSDRVMDSPHARLG